MAGYLNLQIKQTVIEHRTSDNLTYLSQNLHNVCLYAERQQFFRTGPSGRLYKTAGNRYQIKIPDEIPQYRIQKVHELRRDAEF